MGSEGERGDFVTEVMKVLALRTGCGKDRLEEIPEELRQCMEMRRRKPQQLHRDGQAGPRQYFTS